MTPTLPPRRTTSDRLLRLLPVAACLLFLAAPASAQLPIPAVDLAVPTPVGATSVHAGPDGARLCTQDAVATDMVPNNLPVAADAALDACASAGLGGVDARMANHISADADGIAHAGTGITADPRGARVEAEAQTGLFSTVVDWFLSLF